MLAQACAPPCRQVCRKVLFECDNLDSDRVALDECEASCQQQDAVYQVWQDEEKQDLFDAHKSCIGSSTCEEIAAGACYEGYEELFLF